MHSARLDRAAESVSGHSGSLLRHQQVRGPRRYRRVDSCPAASSNGLAVAFLCDDLHPSNYEAPVSAPASAPRRLKTTTVPAPGDSSARVVSASRFRSNLWTMLLLAAGIALLAGAAFHALRHVHGLPPRPAQGASASNLNQIGPWMTLGYISRTYAVPEPVLLHALQLEPFQARRHTLAGIAVRKRVPVRTVVGQVRDAIRQYRAANPAPATPPARPGP